MPFSYGITTKCSKNTYGRSTYPLRDTGVSRYQRMEKVRGGGGEGNNVKWKISKTNEAAI